MNTARDSLGRYKKGRKASDEPIIDRIKKMYSLEESWKLRPNYIGDIKNECPRIYGVWRGIRFTKKGKKIGCSAEWSDFRTFYKDVRPSYKDGLLFRRLDYSKPYGKDNFIWVTKEESDILMSGLVWIEWGGMTLTLKQWAEELNISFYALKSRYSTRIKYGYTTEEILFGRKRKRNSKVAKDYTEVELIRAKASKMISSYKAKDAKNGFNRKDCDITIDWMIDNIFSKPCVYCGDIRRIGCDRIDNDKPHTIDNIVPCCIECNTARNNYFSFEEMKIIGESIRQVKIEPEESKITIEVQ